MDGREHLTLGGVMMEILVSLGKGSKSMEEIVSSPSSSVSFCTPSGERPVTLELIDSLHDERG